jgi:dipeptide/tripeptide permease
MFYQLFDILPNFIDDWVDSRGLADALIGIFGEGAVPTINGGNLTQEWMINFNALLISLFAFAMGYLTGMIRSLTAIIVGIAVSAVAIYALGLSMTGWVTLGAIALFSAGEMSASPTKMRYLSSIAPPGKQGQYMGYVNFTVGIGWSVGSVVAGQMYQEGGDKIVLARRYLEEKLGMAAEKVAELDRGDVLEVLYAKASAGPFEARRLLWDAYSPQSMWLVFALIGVASMLAIVAYDVAVRRAEGQPKHPFNDPRTPWVLGALVPIVGAFTYFTVTAFSLGLLLNTAFFAAMLIIAVLERVRGGKNGRVSEA